MDGPQGPAAGNLETVVQQLIQRYGAAIVQYCRLRLGEAVGEEVAQEVFVTVWQKMAEPQVSWALEALPELLFGIARNKCRQTYRNWARRRVIHQTFAEEIRQRAHAEKSPAPQDDEMQAALRFQLHAGLTRLRDTDR